MTFALVDLLLIVGLALLVGMIGVGFGIFFLAPRLARLADRNAEHNDEDPGAGTD